MAWWQVLLGIIVGLIILTLLVVLHELGHSWAAIKNGVEVEEFGIGLPPTAKKWKMKGKFLFKKGTEFSLNWLPIGGFCRMKGETDDAKDKGTYGAASLWAKTKILLAGVTANFLAAVVIFTILSVTGMPKIFQEQFEMPGDTKTDRTPVLVGVVGEGTAASRAGISVGDEIIKINTEEILEPAQLTAATKANAGQEVSIIYKHDGSELEKNVILGDGSDGKGNLGVSSSSSATLHSTWSAPIVGVVTSFQLLWLTLDGLWDLLINLTTGIVGSIAHTETAANLAQAGDAVSGPVGILGGIFPAAMAGGIGELAFITGIISLSLAVMNLLPIPGLDGGRWFLTLLFRFILRRPLKEETESKINAVGMLILFTLIGVITIVDVVKMF